MNIFSGFQSLESSKHCLDRNDCRRHAASLFQSLFLYWTHAMCHPVERQLLIICCHNKFVADKVRADLALVEYVATTTDIWTSVQTKGYITLTFHYITPSWKLESPVLATVQLASQHTAVNTTSELEKLAIEWKIKR